MSDTKIFPEPFQTRERIESMSEATDEDLIYKNGFRYLYLVAGRISELVGEYSPKGTDPQLKRINGNEVVIFPIRTARRKGGWRPVVLPYSKKFEEWTEPVYEWFKNFGATNPFDLNKYSKAKKKHYKRYFQWKAEEVFKDHLWRRESYRRNGKVEDEKDKKFRLLWLRDQRIRELRDVYNFYGEEIRMYTGLTNKKFDRIKSVITPPNEPLEEPNYNEFLDRASGYFEKLLVERNGSAGRI